MARNRAGLQHQVELTIYLALPVAYQRQQKSKGYTPSVLALKCRLGAWIKFYTALLFLRRKPGLVQTAKIAPTVRGMRLAAKKRPQQMQGLFRFFSVWQSALTLLLLL